MRIHPRASGLTQGSFKSKRVIFVSQAILGMVVHTYVSPNILKAEIQGSHLLRPKVFPSLQSSFKSFYVKQNLPYHNPKYILTVITHLAPYELLK